MFRKQTIYFEIATNLSEQCSLPPAAFFANKIIPFSLKARCEVGSLPPAVFWGQKLSLFEMWEHLWWAWAAKVSIFDGKVVKY